jgi:hypothetical protein
MQMPRALVAVFRRCNLQTRTCREIAGIPETAKRLPEPVSLIQGFGPLAGPRMTTKAIGIASPAAHSTKASIRPHTITQSHSMIDTPAATRTCSAGSPAPPRPLSHSGGAIARRPVAGIGLHRRSASGHYRPTM